MIDTPTNGNGSNGNGGKKSPLDYVFQSTLPFWFPDSQAFLMLAMIVMTATALFYRMTHPSEVNDKILDMMITISFSTCLVLIYNYAFGNSSSGNKVADTQSRITEKLTSTAPPGPTGPVAPVPAPAAIVAWWSLLTDDERGLISTAAPNDPKVSAFMSSAQTGKASPDDLAYLVGKNLITQARADVIKAS